MAARGAADLSRPITFLSDYGAGDEFVGVCHAVIARIAPGAAVIDIAHGIRRHDLAHGAAVLAASLPYSPPGVHLAIVDPGVGGPRRAIAARAAEDERLFVGPDNGLLAPALDRFGGAVAAVDVSATPVRLEPVSATFHGRDLFAPVAAHLARGAELAGLGEPVDPGGLLRLERPMPRVGEGELEAEVSHLDGFGNVVLAAAAGDATAAGFAAGAALLVEGPEGAHEARLGRAFADVPEGSLLLHVDSSGALALAVNRGSAAELLGARGGVSIRVRAR